MPSSVQLIRATTLSDVAEYAYAATAPKDARLIFLAGSCPLNEDGTTAAIGDYAGQAQQVTGPTTVRGRGGELPGSCSSPRPLLMRRRCCGLSRLCGP